MSIASSRIWWGLKQWTHSAMDLEMLDARHDITSRWADKRVDSNTTRESLRMATRTAAMFYDVAMPDTSADWRAEGDEEAGSGLSKTYSYAATSVEVQGPCPGSPGVEVDLENWRALRALRAGVLTPRLQQWPSGCEREKFGLCSHSSAKSQVPNHPKLQLSRTREGVSLSAWKYARYCQRYHWASGPFLGMLSATGGALK